MQVNFSDIVDIPKLQSLMETFYAATGIPSGIVDFHGDILVAVGWRDICAKFHRQNPGTEILCRQSDSYIKNHLDLGQPYIWYKCANGLIDAAAPIIVDGVHLATIFQGQFLFEEPDVEQFRQHAQKYGLNEKDYLKALNNVPIYTKEKLDSIMCYFRQLAENLAEMGMTKLRLLESQARTLRDLQFSLKAIVDNTPNFSIRVFGADGKIRYMNKTAERIFNCPFEEAKGKSLDQLGFDLKTVRLFQDAFGEAETLLPVGPIEWDFKNNGGIEKSLYTTIFPISIQNKKEFFFMDVDISERKQLENELARIEKLNLIGEMAAGLGHEVRNPITTVRGFLQILGKRELSITNKDYYNLMIDELDRANAIITEFLSLAKNKAVKLELKNLNSVIANLAPLIEANVFTINQNIMIELGNIPELLLDEQEIRQLILNLVRNGMEAMDSGGLLTIKTFIDGDEVVLLIQDQGHGISEELLENIGTPFFSTKESGTGLGLAVCYSIATRHKARILVESGKEGTAFSVRFCPSSGL
jgi:PAS domain S-box-containing protein